MTIGGLAYFDTALGTCGLAWAEHGIVGCLLPRADGSAARDRFARRHPGWPEATPPPQIQQVIADIVELLRGKRVDLAYARLDLSAVPPFHRRVYERARRIAPGETMTYGEMALQLGDPQSARAVGQALGANPIPIIVPCHRVLAAGGRAGGFSAPGGVNTKLRLLYIERARIGSMPTLFDD